MHWSGPLPGVLGVGHEASCSTSSVLWHLRPCREETLRLSPKGVQGNVRYRTPRSGHSSKIPRLRTKTPTTCPIQDIGLASTAEEAQRSHTTPMAVSHDAQQQKSEEQKKYACRGQG